MTESEGTMNAPQSPPTPQTTTMSPRTRAHKQLGSFNDVQQLPGSVSLLGEVAAAAATEAAPPTGERRAAWP